MADVESDDEEDSGVNEKNRKRTFPEPSTGLFDKKVRTKRKCRTRYTRSTRKVVRPASDSDNEEKPRYSKDGTLDMVPTVLVQPLRLPQRFKSDASIPVDEIEQFLRQEANEKDSRSEESEEGEIEPATEERSAKLKHIVSSDESDIETKVARSKRRANIEESDASDTKSSADSEPSGFLTKKKAKRQRRVEQSDSSESENLSDFVVSDDEPPSLEEASVKNEKNDSASSDSR